MGPLAIGACVGGCIAVGRALGIGRRGPRGRRRRRGFFGFMRRRRGPSYIDRYGERYGWSPSPEQLAWIRRLVHQYANLFCRAHPPCTRARILGDDWARGYVARQVAVAVTGSNFEGMAEPAADWIAANMGRLL